MHSENYFIRTFRTQWADCDNVTVSLFARDDPETQIGIVELKLYKQASIYPGTAYIWNLWVEEAYRRQLHGQRLLTEALQIVRQYGYHTAELDWDVRDSPRWVLLWYERQGFRIEKFSKTYVLLKMEI